MDAIVDVMANIATIALTWLPLVFFGLIVYLLWRSLALMPRVKPTEVEPDSKSSVSWEDIAGVEEAAAELQEVVDFLQHPRRFSRLGARVPKGSCCAGLREQARRCWPRPLRTPRTRTSTHRAPPPSSRCSPASVPPASASCSRRRAATSLPSSSSTSSTPSACRSGSSFNREHDQTLNQLLVELDGFRSPTVSSSSRRRTAWRISTPPSFVPVASTGRSSSPRPISPAARRSSACTRGEAPRCRRRP